MNLDEQIQLAKGFRAEGYTLSDLAWLFDVDRATIRRWFSQELPSSGLLQPGDVAALLAISPKKVRSLIRSGAIRASNLNDARRPRFVIRSQDLETFIASRQVDAAPTTRQFRRAVSQSGDRY